MVSNGDPLSKLRLVVGYTVVVVWAIMFIVALIEPPTEPTVYLSVQAVMMVVAGSLYAERIMKRKNGRNGDNQ